jgi:heat shock protein HslJ
MTRMIAASLGIALALNPLAALACTSPTPPRFDGGSVGFEGGVSISVGRMAGVVWRAVTIDGVPVPKAADLWLSVAFADGKVSGGTGCNHFTGQADLDAGELILGPLAVTKLACADPVAMEREAAYLQALGEVRWFIVAPEGLWLSREDGSVAVCLG